MLEQAKRKLAPGLLPGEHPGSLMQALAAVAPGMKHDAAAMAPGVTPHAMVDAMMEGWRRRQAGAPALAPLPMDADPRLAPPPPEAAR